MSKKHQTTIHDLPEDKWYEIFSKHGLTMFDSAAMPQTSRQFHGFFRRFPELITPNNKISRQISNHDQLGFIPYSNRVLVYQHEDHRVHLKSALTWNTIAKTEIIEEPLSKIIVPNSDIFVTIHKNHGTIWSVTTCQKIATLSQLRSDTYCCHNSQFLFFRSGDTEISFFDLVEESPESRVLNNITLKHKNYARDLNTIGNRFLEVPIGSRTCYLYNISRIEAPTLYRSYEKRSNKNETYACSPDDTLYSVREHSLCVHPNNNGCEAVVSRLFNYYSQYKRGWEIDYELHFLDNHRVVIVSRNHDPGDQYYDEYPMTKYYVSIIDIQRRKIIHEFHESHSYNIHVGSSKIYNLRTEFGRGYEPSSNFIDTYIVSEPADIDLTTPSSRCTQPGSSSSNDEGCTI